MRILGIDPGLAIVGWAVIDSNRGKLTPVAYGAITTPAHTDIEARLLMIKSDLEEIIKRYEPDEMAIEELFFNTNITTLADLGAYFGRLFPIFGSASDYVNPNDWIVILKDVGIFAAIGILFLTPMPRRIYEKYKDNKPLTVSVMLVLFWLSVYLIFCEGANPMVY